MPNLAPIQSQLRQHEQWLIGLRHDPSKTLRQIKTDLYNQKRIAVSDNQLETFFSKIGQRKNLSQAEWRTVFRVLDSQRDFGRVYDLYISGKLIVEKTLQSKRRKIKPTPASAPSPYDADRMLTQLPEGVTVKRRLPRDSPGPSLQHRIDSQPPLEAGSTTNAGREPSMLRGSISADNDVLEPSAGILNVDASSRSFGSRSAITRIPSAYQGQLIDFSATTEAHQTPQDINSLIMLELERETAFPSFNLSISEAWAREFSPFNSRLDLQPQDLATQDDLMMDMLMPAERGYGNHISATPIESDQLLLQGFVSGISRRGPHGMHKPLPTAEELLDNLESLVSIEDMGEFHESLHVVHDNVLFADRFVQLFLFAIANNFAGIDNIPTEMIMNLMNQHAPLRSSILSCLAKGESTIFSSALTEKLLKAAIEGCDAKTVHDILALKVVKPDDIICMEWRYRRAPFGGPIREIYRRTPLERASTMRHFEIMELLLRFGADVNKTYVVTKSTAEKGALECAIRLWDEYCPIDHKIVDLLLDKGAIISGRLAEAVICWGDTRLIEKLMSRFLPSEHVHCFSSNMLIDAAEYLKNDISLKIVQQAIKTCRDMHDSICIGSNQRLAIVMAQAARRQNTELVCLLIPHGGQDGLDWALTGAVRSGSHSLVHLLIKHGARGDGPGRNFPQHDIDGPRRNMSARFISTPLAEAIRADDDELVELLAKEGAWNQIGESSRLKAALQAVAQSGSLVYLDKILQLVPHPDPEDLAGPLYVAITAGHEEVALRLMSVGADVNKENSLLASLRKRSQSIFWAILESDVEVRYGDRFDGSALELAAAWGDPQIIRALVFMGVDINACSKELPLIIAIRAGDRSSTDLLISLGADLNAFSGDMNAISGDRNAFSGGMSPLAAAMLVQDEEIASYLLDHGANPANETAFINAAMHDRGLLNLVFQAFNKQYPKRRIGFGGRVLHHALNTQDDALLELCLNANFDVNALVGYAGGNKVSALGLAIIKYSGGRLELVSKLLDAGGDANIPASQRSDCFPFPDSPEKPIRQTAFLDAIETKSLPLVELLISKGANVQMEAKWGLKRTPLQKACEVGSHAIVDVLLAHSADANAAPAVRGGATAFQLAAKAGSTRIAKTLLAAGADVNAPGAQVEGKSAFNYAATYGRPYMIQFLWNITGARFTVDECKSAIEVAREYGHPACAALIMKLSSGSQGLIDA
ncbi:ankyrin [Xylaria cf. heliscus]|nr:ankyrin [Xylaria cf. heliscus]